LEKIPTNEAVRGWKSVLYFSEKSGEGVEFGAAKVPLICNRREQFQTLLT